MTIGKGKRHIYRFHILQRYRRSMAFHGLSVPPVPVKKNGCLKGINHTRQSRLSIPECGIMGHDSNG